MAKAYNPDGQLIPNVTIRDAEVRYLNFEGRETQFKAAGNRSFRLMLPDDLADKMHYDGWNVNQTKPHRGATDAEIASFEPRPYIEVALSYKFERMAPKIRLITSAVQRQIGEDLAFLVDQEDIVKIDLTINPSAWEVGEKSGIKAYLTEAFITVNESDLEREYNHIPLEGATVLHNA